MSTSVDDFKTDPSISRWREKALHRGYCSNIALPLTNPDGVVFGIMVLRSCASNKPVFADPHTNRI